MVGVAVILGLIVLLKGGTVGFGKDASSVSVPEGDAAAATTTSAAPTTTAAPSVPPASVKVVVANGSGTSGLARTVATTLSGVGYTSSSATDAVGQQSATTVYFAQGYEANAQAIGSQLGLDASRVQSLPPGANLAKVQPSDLGVLVVLGPDATSTGASNTSGATNSSGNINSSGGAATPPTTG